MEAPALTTNYHKWARTFLALYPRQEVLAHASGCVGVSNVERTAVRTPGIAGITGPFAVHRIQVK